MLFAEVLGHVPLKQHLIKLVKNDKVPHALLFHEYSGAGGLAMALAFSQFLQCENKGDSDSCGECNACKKASRLIHPDIHYTFPVFSQKSNTPPKSNDFLINFRQFALQSPYSDYFTWISTLTDDNKQGNITADEARYIIRQLNMKPYEGIYKVQIIWGAEYLGKEGNILLKLIEEPPPNTIIILVAENPEEILPTILSRTQIVNIPALEDHYIKEALIAAGHDSNEAEAAAYIAEGSYAHAITIISKKEENYALLFTEWMRALLTLRKSAGILTKWCDKLHSMGRERSKDFLEYSLHFFRQTLLQKYMPATEPRLTDNEKKISGHLQQYIDVLSAERIESILSDTLYAIERNGYIKAQMMNASLQISTNLQKN
jgi:DNA polymerase-3 subunit delta'